MNQAIVNIQQIMDQAIEQIADKTGGDIRNVSIQNLLLKRSKGEKAAS